MLSHDIDERAKGRFDLTGRIDCHVQVRGQLHLHLHRNQRDDAGLKFETRTFDWHETHPHTDRGQLHHCRLAVAAPAHRS